MFEGMELAGASSAGRASTQHKARILVVDDSKFIRELLRIHLANAGYEVMTAEDALIGGQVLLQQRPDLLILDVDMPFMSGIELAQFIRADSAVRDLPIVFLTSHDDVAEAVREVGGVAQLTKPVTVEELLDVVAQHTPAQ